MLVVASAAWAATVCPSDPSLTPVCDHPDLAAGLASADTTLELLPGEHVGGLLVDRTVDVVALVGAVMVAGPPDLPVFQVTASGVTLSGLVYAPVQTLVDPPLLTVRGADVTVTALLADGVSGLGAAPVLIAEEGAVVTLVDPVVIGASNSGQGVIHVQDATLVVHGGVFQSSTAYSGGAIWARSSALTLLGTRISDSAATSFDGNALWVRGGSLVLEDVVIEGGLGGSDSLWEVHLEEIEATITRGSITGGSTGFTTGIFADGLTRLDIVGTRLAGWPWAALYAVDTASLTIDGAILEGNRSPDFGGALSIWGVGDLRIDRSWFCGNQSLTGGAVDLLGCDGSCTIAGSVFQGNTGGLGGAIASSAPLAVDHCTFRGNFGVGGAVFSEPPLLAMSGSLVVEQGADGHALDSVAAPEVFVDNGFGGNLGGDATFAIADPANRTGLTVIFEPGPGLCGEGVTLADGNDDWLFDHGVGAIVDEDRDGVANDLDCDDARPDVHPGAPEIPADGTDQDCDGTELCPVDLDADGYGTAADRPSSAFDCSAARGDCDDASPIRHPGSSEVWYDGMDGDCAGDDDFDQDRDGVRVELDCDDLRAELGACEVRVGGGCRTVGGGVGIGGFVGLFLMRSRRGGR